MLACIPGGLVTRQEEKFYKAELFGNVSLVFAYIIDCHSLSLAAVNPDWFYFLGFTFLVLAHPVQNPRGP